MVKSVQHCLTNIKSDIHSLQNAIFHHLDPTLFKIMHSITLGDLPPCHLTEPPLHFLITVWLITSFEFYAESVKKINSYLSCV